MSEKDTEIEDLPAADLETDLVELDLDTDLGDTDLPDLEASDDLLDPFVGDSLEGDPLGGGDEHALDDLPAAGDDEALSHDELSGALDDFEPDHLEDDGMNDDIAGGPVGLGSDDGLADDTPEVVAEEVPLDEDPDDLEPITLSEEELDNILGTGEDVLVDLADTPEPEEAPDDFDTVEPVAGDAADNEAFEADLESAPVVDELGLDDVTSGETLTPMDDLDGGFDDQQVGGFDDAPVDMGDDLGDEPVIMDDLPDEISDDLSGPDLNEAPAADPMSDEDEEPVALSEAELDNILGDVDMTEPMEVAGDDLPDDLDAGEPAAAMNDGPLVELDDGSDPAPAPAAMDTAGDEDDEDITLSDDELSNVLLDTDDLSDAASDGVIEEAPALDEFGADEMDSPLDLGEGDDTPSILDGDDDEDDEPVTLSMEELGNIVSDVDTEDAEDAVGTVPDELGDDLSDDLPMADLDESPMSLDDDSGLDAGLDDAPSILDDDEDEEPIALSEDELSNILEDVDEEQAEDIVAPVADGMDDKNIIVLDEYEELGDPAEEPAEEMPVEEPVEEPAPVAAAVAVAEAPDRSELVASTAATENVDPGEMKKMISYLDGLFDQLPESTIKEFSKSEYFDLYKKIMGDLGLLK